MDTSRVRFSKYEIYPNYFGPVLEKQVRDFIFDLDKFLVLDLTLNYSSIEFKLDISMQIESTKYTFYDATILTHGFNESVDQKKAEDEKLGFVCEGKIIKVPFDIFDRQNEIAKPNIVSGNLRYQLFLSSVGHPELSRSNFDAAANNCADFSLDFRRAFSDLKKKYSFIM